MEELLAVMIDNIFDFSVDPSLLVIVKHFNIKLRVISKRKSVKSHILENWRFCHCDFYLLRLGRHSQVYLFKKII